MRYNGYRFSWLINRGLMAGFLLLLTAGLQASPVRLQVEYMEHPMGIDIAKPRFSWQMETTENRRGAFQTAYRIVVSDPDGKEMWDTKKTKGQVSLGIRYEGLPLLPCTPYSWELTVWDEKGNPSNADSWFETGLMDPSLRAWEGAEWIGAGDRDLVLYSHYLSVFCVEFGLRLDASSGSTKAGFLLGVNDHRLLDKNGNIYGIESERNGHYIRFELDISALESEGSGPARLLIYRVGYHPDDRADKALFSLDIPPEIISQENRYENHQFRIRSMFGTLNLWIDEKEIGSSPPSGETDRNRSVLNINPMGVGGDYIAFPMLADIGFRAGPGQKAFFSNLAVRNYRYPSNILFHEDLSLPAYNGIFAGETGQGFGISEQAYLIDGGKDGKTVVADPSAHSMPLLRTGFRVPDGEIESARLYVTARGIYEMYLNGERVGNDYFNPGLTQYNISHMYQTYDLTDGILAGKDNALGACLGEGWWSGNYTYTGSNWNYFGDRQSLLAKLVITYRDGRVETLTTNEREWKCYTEGPVLYGSFFQGEVYDARKESAIKGWSEPDFDDTSWKPAELVPLEGTACVNPDPGNSANTESFLSFDRMSLTGQIGENVRVTRIIHAREVKEVRPGVFVYDMGQNMVGVPSFTLPEGKEGQVLRMRYAEVLYPDMEEYAGLEGMLMLENIRGAHAQDLYILKKGENTVSPRFSFHGYRYLEITGLEEALPPEEICGRVLSSITDFSSDYHTSNSLVNRLWENICWSMTGNFLSIPTDCPQRNERMGWSGDISVFSRTATYLANVDLFFKRHLMALRDMQAANGRFSDVAPVGVGFGGILWGSAGITLPWEAWLQYGDRALLEEHYPAMVRYMDFLATRTDEKTGVMTEGPLGDWLSPEVNKNDNSLLFCAYYVFDLEIMTRVARVLGKTADAHKWQKLYEERKTHFNACFVDPETGKTRASTYRPPMPGPFGGHPDRFPGSMGSEGEEPEIMDTQASYAIPLALGVFDENHRETAAEHLSRACLRQNIDDGGILRPPLSLMTGFIGTAWISAALSDNGYEETAYLLLQQEAYPSWLYPVTQGATTIWERLNSYTGETGFGNNNSMNSFNHYSFGAVGQWLIGYSLGIRRDESSPGFRHFYLRPEPDPTGKMHFAGGHYDSMYGRIESSWSIEEGMLYCSFSVPANTSACLYLPAGDIREIREGGKKIRTSGDIQWKGMEGRYAVMEIPAGRYRFSVPWEGGE